MTLPRHAAPSIMLRMVPLPRRFAAWEDGARQLAQLANPPLQSGGGGPREARWRGHKLPNPR